jgi:hypothetical protein
MNKTQLLLAAAALGATLAAPGFAAFPTSDAAIVAALDV